MFVSAFRSLLSLAVILCGLRGVTTTTGTKLVVACWVSGDCLFRENAAVL